MTIANDFFNRLIGTWENKINGEWKNQFGWDFISQPKFGDPSKDDFTMRVDQMLETITFKDVGKTRNVGITGDADFWHAIAYEVSIQNTKGEPIHQEMGHFLLHVLENGDTEKPLEGNIIRQGTTPRGNSMMTFGILKKESVSKAADDPSSNSFYNALPISKDSDFQAKVAQEFQKNNKEILALGGPDLSSPLTWLETILDKDVIGFDWVFSFRDNTSQSKMVSAERVPNPVGVGDLLSDFWIGKRKIDGFDRELDILQYAQKVDLIFNGMNWPHVAVNTLVKQP